MQRHLVVDIGNTRAKIGVFVEDVLESLTYKSIDINGRVIRSIALQHKIDGIMMASTSQNSHKIKNEIGDIYTILMSEILHLPFRHSYVTPYTLGQDRIAGIVGSMRLFPDRNVLCIDAGTCVTYDVIEKPGIHRGGIISPGHKMRLKAMNSFTQRLPYVEMNYDVPFLGVQTEHCLQSGGMHTLRLEIEGIIEEVKSQYEDMQVILTGGDAEQLVKVIGRETLIEPHLVLYGLHEIYKFNE